MMGRSSSVWISVVLAVLLCIWSAYAVEQCPSKIANCYIMHPGDEWHRPIDTDPVDYMSACHIKHMNGSYIKLDMADGTVPGYTIYNTGIPYNIIGNWTPLLPLRYGVAGENYQDESDFFGDFANPTFPFPQNASIEGWNGTIGGEASSGDRHILAVDTDNCKLYESYGSIRKAPGFNVSCSAIWNMTVANYARPDGWTSADAAGLPIFPGLLRYDEVASGYISHPLRFTYPQAQYSYTFPGNHFGPSGHKNITMPVYGSRYRLKSTYDETQFSTLGQVIVRAMKQYGIIFADQGSGIYISGVSDTRWAAAGIIDEFNSNIRIPITQFEMVQPPKTIVRGWSPGTVTCNGVSQNTNPTWTPTWTPMAQCFGSPTPSPSQGYTPSVTPTPSSTPSRTPSATPTKTPTPSRTPSVTPSVTPSKTPSPTRTPSVTSSPSPSRSSSPSLPPSPGSSPSATPSPVPSTSATPTRTPSVTPSINAAQSSSPSPNGHGGACGGAAVVGLAAAGFFVYKRRQNSGSGAQPAEDVGGAEHSMVPLTTAAVSQPVLKPRYAVGSTVMAKFSSDGKFYKATVVDFKDGQYLVKYPEYNDDQEWLPESSLKFQ